eukprot:TRINITY_DN63234_c0_g1_i1.p1 TRINITY_DN63234_c0_g1~~TRINITY_DN63234_c0_g1_i1.p1  ORF type:complete len:647 (+),score=92.43 TRINITY_DN63234_c0_g1_i1:120-2060(+)
MPPSGVYRMSDKRRAAVIKEENTRGRPILVTPEEMKETVRERLLERGRPYSAADYYRTSGIWQYMVRSEIFELASLATVSMNAVWIAIDTDHNDATALIHARLAFQFMENAFCCFFLFEWLARLLAFNSFAAAVCDKWFVFDGFVVSFQVFDTWLIAILYWCGVDITMDDSDTSDLSLIRLARFSRVLRLTRLIRLVPEMGIMLRAVGTALRTVFYTSLFMAISLFLGGLVFVQIAADTPLGTKYFSNIVDSMSFLLLHATLLQSTDYKLLEIMAEGNLLLTTFFLACVVFCSVLLMNLFVGMLCNVVTNAAAYQREEANITSVKDTLKKVIRHIDKDGSGAVSKSEVQQILGNRRAMKALDRCGVKPQTLVDLSDDIFEMESRRKSVQQRKSAGVIEDGRLISKEDEEDTELTLDEFVNIVLELRDTNFMSQKDLLMLRQQINHCAHENQRRIKNLLSTMASFTSQVKTLYNEVEEDRRLRRERALAAWPEEMRRFLLNPQEEWDAPKAPEAETALRSVLCDCLRVVEQGRADDLGSEDLPTGLFQLEIDADVDVTDNGRWFVPNERRSQPAIKSMPWVASCSSTTPKPPLAACSPLGAALIACGAAPALGPSATEHHSAGSSHTASGLRGGSVNFRRTFVKCSG